MTSFGYKGFSYCDGSLYGRNKFKYEIGVPRYDADNGLYFGFDIDICFLYYNPTTPCVRFGRVMFDPEQVIKGGSVGIAKKLTLVSLLHGAYHFPLIKKTYIFDKGVFVRIVDDTDTQKSTKSNSKKIVNVNKLRELRCAKFCQ